MGKLYSVLAVAALALVMPLSALADPTTIKAKDDCDPVSFNLAVPGNPPTCVGNGSTTFDDFVGQLAGHGFAGAWRFSPGHVTINAGSSLRIVNQGGETHTFTQVTQFGGGGIVPPINLILFGTTTPPMFFFPPLNIVPAGGSLTIPAATLTPGTHLFFCAIHPWMQETVRVS